MLLRVQCYCALHCSRFNGSFQLLASSSQRRTTFTHDNCPPFAGNLPAIPQQHITKELGLSTNHIGFLHHHDGREWNIIGGHSNRPSGTPQRGRQKRIVAAEVDSKTVPHLLLQRCRIPFQTGADIPECGVQRRRTGESQSLFHSQCPPQKQRRDRQDPNKITKSHTRRDESHLHPGRYINRSAEDQQGNGDARNAGERGERMETTF